VGHFNAYSRGHLADWVAKIAPYLVEVHLHDNAGDGDRHLIPGKGSFDFKTLFAILGQARIDPVLCLEVSRLKDVLIAVEAMTRILEACAEDRPRAG
jgi:sugar phosphate isomerase/epimerase